MENKHRKQWSVMKSNLEKLFHVSFCLELLLYHAVNNAGKTMYYVDIGQYCSYMYCFTTTQYMVLPTLTVNWTKKID